MRKIVEYGILSNTRLEELIHSVREAMKTGWEPLGGMSIASNYLKFFQTMVKYENI